MVIPNTVALEVAFDAIFADPSLKRLVIDVRINLGGADPYGLALASRRSFDTRSRTGARAASAGSASARRARRS